MTISQGGCPRGTCPRDLSRRNRPKPIIPQWFPPIWQTKAAAESVVPLLVVPQSMSQAPGSSVGWHTVVGDLKAEYHNVNDPTGDRPWLRLSRLRDNEANAHRGSGVPSCDDLLRCSR